MTKHGQSEVHETLDENLLTEDELDQTAGAAWRWRGNWQWRDSGGYYYGDDDYYYYADNYHYYYD